MNAEEKKEVIGIVADAVKSASYAAADKYIKEYASVTASDLAKRLIPKILDVVKPFTLSNEDLLKDELAKATIIITEINKTWLGWLLLKRIEKKLQKQAEKI